MTDLGSTCQPVHDARAVESEHVRVGIDRDADGTIHESSLQLLCIVPLDLVMVLDRDARQRFICTVFCAALQLVAIDVLLLQFLHKALIVQQTFTTPLLIWVLVAFYHRLLLAVLVGVVDEASFATIVPRRTINQLLHAQVHQLTSTLVV